MKKFKQMNWLKPYRFWAMWVSALAVAGWYWYSDPNGGMQLMTQLQSMVGPLAVLGLVYFAAKAFQPGDSITAWNKAMEGSLPNAILVLARAVLIGLLFLGFVNRALASELPPGAKQDLPILVEEIHSHWQTMSMPSVLGALVEQESGWKVMATLKTSREEGVGYGQFTRAYRADGSLRFDALAEVTQMDSSLKGWTWQRRFDPRMQLRAVVVKNRACYRHLRPLLDNDYNAFAMCDAAYNGGEGGLMAERRLCTAIKNCDPKVWFGNVALYSTKSRDKWNGYGTSAYEINRTHVINVMIKRRPHYVIAMGA